MRISKHFMKGCYLLSALLMFFPIKCYATTFNKAFRSCINMRKAQALSLSLTHSDTIPLHDMGVVYALSIDATITQPRESSFVRIVLEDVNGHNYLVAESDCFRNDTSLVQLSRYCEETALLDGITPLRLKCYLAGGASLTLTGIYSADVAPECKAGVISENVRSIREEQVSDIVERINVYNDRHLKLWRARKTSRALESLHNRINQMVSLDGDDAYTANIIYYDGGIYEIGESEFVPPAKTSSNCVEDFDWRNRHGKNWITSIKNQGNSGYCVAFAFCGMLEAKANLYFNRKLDLNLSEQDIVYNYARDGYSIIDSIYTRGMSTYYAFTSIYNNGVLDDASVPFIDAMQHTIPPRPTGNECLRFSNKNTISPNSNNIETIKQVLIQHGPLVGGISSNATAPGRGGHAMALVGYHTIHAGDTVHQVKMHNEGGLFSYIIVPQDHYLIGKTYWVFKDNYGEDAPGKEHGYLYLWFKTYECMSPLHYTTSAIISRNYSDSDIAIEDRDGDGYFNWGIGPRPNNRLPEWAEQEEDGDDSNCLNGPLDDYGNLAALTYPDTIIIIDHDMTDIELVNTYNNGRRFLHQSIKLNSGVTLTIQGALAFYSGKLIYMNNNSVLKVDGGTLVDARPYKSTSGGKVIVKNGGKILCHKKTDFTLPIGIMLDVDEGCIVE